MSENVELVKLLQWAETVAEDDYDDHAVYDRLEKRLRYAQSRRSWRA